MDSYLDHQFFCAAVIEEQLEADLTEPVVDGGPDYDASEPPIIDRASWTVNGVSIFGGASMDSGDTESASSVSTPAWAPSPVKLPIAAALQPPPPPPPSPPVPAAATSVVRQCAVLECRCDLVGTTACVEHG